MFLVIRIAKNSKSTFQKIQSDFLLIEEKGQFPYALIKGFNTFKCNQTLHRNRKYFYLYCLQSFSTEQILEKRVNDCFEINDKQIIKIVKKVKLLNLKTKWGEKSLFMIYAGFESILVPQNNGKQNTGEL